MKRALTALLLTVALATTTENCDAQKERKAAEDKQYTGQIVLNSSGRFKIPEDIKPGTYVSRGSKTCSFRTLRNVYEGSTAGGNQAGPTRGGKNVTITISKMDEYFETDHCNVWRKKVK